MLILTTLSVIALSALLNISVELLHTLRYNETYNLYGSNDILKCVKNNKEYYADMLLNCNIDTCELNEEEYCANLLHFMTDNSTLIESFNFQINRVVIIDNEKRTVEFVVYNVDNVNINAGSPPWHFSYHPEGQTILVSDSKVYPKSTQLPHKSADKSSADYHNLVGSSIKLDFDIFATESNKLIEYNNISAMNHLCRMMPNEFSYENNSFLAYSGIQYESKMLLYFLETCKINMPKIHLSEQITVNEYGEDSDIIQLDFNDKIRTVTEIRDFSGSKKTSNTLVSTIEDYIEIINQGPLHYYSSMGMHMVISNSFFCDYNVSEFKIAIAPFLDTVDVIHAFWRSLMNQQRHAGKSKTLHIHPLFHTSSPASAQNEVENDSKSELYERKKHVMNKRNFDIAVSDGLVHVVLCVLPEQLHAAQEIVHSWRHNCLIKHTCAMYTRYHINLVLPKNMEKYAESHAYEGGSKCNRNISCFEVLQQEPSVRSSLIQVDDIINYFVTPLDVVVILVGMEAILSFPQPATSNNGLIPFVPFGGHAFYRLKNDIVFGNYDMKAIAGVGTSIRYMISSLKQCEWDMLPPLTESTLLNCFDRYVKSNPEIISLDDGTIFNFSTNMRNIIDEDCILTIDMQENVHIRSPDYFELIASDLDLMSADILSSNCSNITELSVEEITSSVIGYVSDNIPQGRWDSCSSLIVRLYDLLIALYQRNCLVSQVVESAIHQLLSKFVQLGLSSKYYNFMTTLEEYQQSADIISRAISNYSVQRKTVSSVLDAMHFRFVEAAWSALANIHQELGPVEMMSMAIASSASSSTQYNEYKHRSDEWEHQRNNLVVSSNSAVHVITAASDDTVGLKKLRLSALIAGVTLNVVGLGRKYGSYYDKILWYYEYLHEANNGINDDHVVLLIDAYDVLLFPSVRRIGKLLKKSPAPIVACTEHGSHPEMSAAFLYPRGFDVENNLFHDYIALQRYLNSGCIAGRAGQMKQLLQYAMQNGKTLYDDQMLYIRYMLARPDQIHLDISSQIFLTTHAITKQQNSSFFLLPDLNLIMVVNKTVIIKENIAVLHANNMGNIDATSVYGVLSSDMERRYTDHLSGPDGVLLLQVLHLLWENDSPGSCAWNAEIYKSYFTNPFKPSNDATEVTDGSSKDYLLQALDKLKHPIIVSNMTRNGGRNSLGDSLLQAITYKIQEC